MNKPNTAPLNSSVKRILSDTENTFYEKRYRGSLKNSQYELFYNLRIPVWESTAADTSLFNSLYSNLIASLNESFAKKCKKNAGKTLKESFFLSFEIMSPGKKYFSVKFHMRSVSATLIKEKNFYNSFSFKSGMYIVRRELKAKRKFRLKKDSFFFMNDKLFFG